MRYYVTFPTYLLPFLNAFCHVLAGLPTQKGLIMHELDEIIIYCPIAGRRLMYWWIHRPARNNIMRIVQSVAGRFYLSCPKMMPENWLLMSKEMMNNFRRTLIRIDTADFRPCNPNPAIKPSCPKMKAYTPFCNVVDVRDLAIPLSTTTILGPTPTSQPSLYSGSSTSHYP